jgi:Tfp pilus assembly protein PilP
VRKPILRLLMARSLRRSQRKQQHRRRSARQSPQVTKWRRLAGQPSQSQVDPDAPKEGEEKGARRDPFESLVARQQAQKNATAALPPGKAGLQVNTLRLDGIVKAPNGMIAVVTNPQARTYFLREGDQLYDGRVEKIAMDGVSFHEMGKDAFGKPVERQVNKRIYSSAGEQQ